MSTPIHAQLTGTFVSDGTALNISLPSSYDKFELVNITDVGSPAAATPVMRASGYSSLPAGSAYLNLKTNGAATLAIESMVAANGFTFVADSGATPSGAVVSNITGITNVTQPVVSTNTPVANGSIVRLFGTTGALQLSGMDFTTAGYSAGTSFDLAHVATAPGSAATAGSFIPLNTGGRYYPRTRYITGISQAAQAVVALSVTHNYVVGEKIRMVVPAEWGMSNLNGQLATIVAVGAVYGGTTNTVTINIDTTAMTPFAWPSSATAATGVSFAITVPVGEAATVPYQNLLDDATQNESITGVTVGTAVQTASKLYQWIATKGVQV